jgi:amino acid adenylation domain-containing protein
LPPTNRLAREDALPSTLASKATVAESAEGTGSHELDQQTTFEVVKSAYVEGTFRPFPASELDLPIHARFEMVAQLNDQRIAIQDRSQQCSYSGLNCRANRIAHEILNRSGTASTPVILLLEKSASLFAAMLGTLKAGKFYVPLSPSYPAARNQFIASDARAQLVLTDAANVDGAHEIGLPVINVDEIGPHRDDRNPGISVSADDYAYIIYTSGSSGHPKGVVDTHRNLAQNIRRYTNSHGLTDTDRLICINSCAFSNSLKDIYGALLNGGRLVPYDLEREGIASLANFVMREKITVFNVVATVFRHFAKGLGNDRLESSLRIIRVGSEPVTRKDFDLFRYYFPSKCILVNGYGSTETGTVRVNFLQAGSQVSGSTLPVGYPVDGTEVDILDENGRSVGFDRVGQIVVKSEYLSPGYWNRPDLTRAAFREAPIGSRERTYLTGDYGLMRPDGCLIYLGREDGQVKVRGNRIEVAEVENALTDLPGIAEAVVVVRPELPPDQPLVGYLVAKDGTKLPSAHELRAALQSRLPGPAIPGTFVELATLPVTPTGKIDRKALPAPPAPAHRDAKCSPRTDMEMRLATIWADVLGIKQVGIDDDFFSVGGTSLVAADLINRISKEFAHQVPLACLIDHPTIRDLAQLVESGAKAELPCLVRFRSSNSRPHLYLIHDIGGDVIHYRAMAARLGDAHSVYGIRSRYVTDGTISTSIESMASDYVQEIVRHQPDGPIFLIGYSFGAAIAYEMAQLLYALGRDVPLLGIFDQRRPNLDTSYSWTITAWRRVLDNFLRRLFADSRAFKTEFSHETREFASNTRVRIGLAARQLLQMIRSVGIGHSSEKQGRYRSLDEVRRALEQSDPARRLRKNWLRALRAYRPRPYAGRVLLIQSEFQPIFRWHERMMGWKKLLTGPSLVGLVPGGHGDLCLDPSLQHLVSHWNQTLRRVELPTRSAGAGSSVQ